VRIPEEMAVVGFDDMEWARILTPPLTAVAQPGYDLGVAAGQLVLRRLQGPSGPPQVVVFQPKLVVRESCGAKRTAEALGAPARGS
jgi:DNA-binding LacI/PurR family transcriptional regulator